MPELSREEALHWLQSVMFPYKPDNGPYLAGMAVSSDDAKKYGDMCAAASGDEQLVIDLARELYDRFVMGGWEPQDAYPQIRAMLSAAPDSRPSTEERL